MALDEPKENEQPVQVNGIGLLVDEFVSAYVEETTVDYLEDEDGEGFIITSGEACSS